jgi:hypothetical protein
MIREKLPKALTGTNTNLYYFQNFFFLISFTPHIFYALRLKKSEKSAIGSFKFEFISLGK